MNQLTEEQQKRLEQIRERRETLKQESKKLAWDVNPFNCLCDKACKPFMTNAPRDIDFLLSLFDSQTAGDGEAERVAMEGIKEGLRQRDQQSAAQMKQRCVRAIHDLPIHRINRKSIIAALELLTLDQVQEKR